MSETETLYKYWAKNEATGEIKKGNMSAYSILDVELTLKHHGFVLLAVEEEGGQG